MILVGLTGGIGSGKSTAAAILRDRGAVVIDADELARRAVARGTPGLDRVIEEFGRDVVGPDGELDRRRIGEIVFVDEARRRALEAIVHPEVARLLGEEIEPHRDTERVVVYSVPLLAELGMAAAFDVVVTVRAGEELRVARIVADRGLSEREVRDRMRSQATDQLRASVSDVSLDNDGSMRDLEEQVDRLWKELETRASAAGR